MQKRGTFWLDGAAGDHRLFAVPAGHLLVFSVLRSRCAPFASDRRAACLSSPIW
ncbi:hypothetical protein M8494_03795 [Serratia ureilytica]